MRKDEAPKGLRGNLCWLPEFCFSVCVLLFHIFLLNVASACFKTNWRKLGNCFVFIYFFHMLSNKGVCFSRTWVCIWYQKCDIFFLLSSFCLWYNPTSLYIEHLLIIGFWWLCRGYTCAAGTDPLHTSLFIGVDHDLMLNFS